MMPTGGVIGVSDTARMLAAAAPDRLLGAGRRRDELLEEHLRLTGHRADPAQRVQRACAVRSDLALELLPGLELVEDLADPFHALGREGRRRLEQRIELRPQTWRPLLERNDHRQRLLSLHTGVHL